MAPRKVAWLATMQRNIHNDMGKWDNSRILATFVGFVDWPVKRCWNKMSCTLSQNGVEKR